jgi:hypothetical protein
MEGRHIDRIVCLKQVFSRVFSIRSHQYYRISIIFLDEIAFPVCNRAM